MKIAQVTSTFPPYQGGIGNVCFRLSEGLSRRGHEVTVFVPQERKPKTPRQVPFRVTYLPSTLTIGNANWLPSLASALHGFDVIHLHYPFFGGDIFVRQAAKRYRTPYVLTYHQDPTADALWKQAAFGLYGRLWQRPVVTDAARILALSPEHFRQSRIRMMIRSEQVAYVPNGVDLADFRKPTDLPDLRRRLGLQPKTGLAVFIGALDRPHEAKRPDIILQALALVARPIHLLLIGGGDRQGEYQALARRLSVEKRVTWLGQQANEALNQYLWSSDFLVLSSSAESFGLVLIEAMACRRPVVASDLPGVRAVVENRVNGLLVQPLAPRALAEAMTWMIDHPAEAQLMGQAGYQRIESRFQWSSVVEKLEAVYHQVTGTG